MKRAVLRRYTVVAFSAADQAGSRCWDVGPPPQQTLDVRRTVASIATLQQVPLKPLTREDNSPHQSL